MVLSFEFDEDWQTKRVRCDQWPESFAMWWLVAALYKRQIYLWIEVKLSVESRSTATVISAVIGCGPREVLLTQSTSNHQSPPHGVLPLDLGIFTPSYLQIGCNKKTSLLCIPIFSWYLGHIPQQGSLTLFSKIGPSKGQQLAEGFVSVARTSKVPDCPNWKKKCIGGLSYHHPLWHIRTLSMAHMIYDPHIKGFLKWVGYAVLLKLLLGVYFLFGHTWTHTHTYHTISILLW